MWNIPVAPQSMDRYTAGLLNAQTLLNKAAEAAADLELQLPPLNAPLVLQRSLIELGMPQVIILCHLHLFEICQTAADYVPLTKVAPGAHCALG